MMRGNLIYLIGPSGAGKDSLIAYARERLDGNSRLLFAHRYITRPAAAGHENYVALSNGEFQLRRDYGLFVLNWMAHGYSYGIGSEVGQWLERGLSVLVNGSRDYLPTARQRLPDLIPCYVDAPQEVLRRRLLERGRETATEIDRRLARLSGQGVPAGCHVIDNGGSLDRAGRQFLDLLCEIAGPVCPDPDRRDRAIEETYQGRAPERGGT